MMSKFNKSVTLFLLLLGFLFPPTFRGYWFYKDVDNYICNIINLSSIIAAEQLTASTRITLC